MFKSNHVRLEKKLTPEEKIEQRKEEMRIWTMKHCFTLITLTILLSLMVFIMLCLLIGPCTESNLYYYHMGGL